jgi:cation diffusion facilitator family transporter
VLKVSLCVLALAALGEGIMAWLTASVGLLADMIHNFSDALVALPLWFAFSLAKKKPSATYPYGLYRVEDFVGLAVVLVIAGSGLWTGYESIQRLIHPVMPQNIALGVFGGMLGALGNEVVARYRLSVGTEIHSHALMAEGHHARVDALTSLGVVVGLVFAALGYPVADPIAGLVITFLIFSIVFETGKALLFRILGKTDDEQVNEIRLIARGIDGVEGVDRIKLQWLGHRCFADLCVTVLPHVSIAEAHRITESVRHELLHHLPALVDVTIHADPFTTESPDPFHHLTAHHF